MDTEARKRSPRILHARLIGSFRIGGRPVVVNRLVAIADALQRSRDVQVGLGIVGARSEGIAIVAERLVQIAVRVGITASASCGLLDFLVASTWCARGRGWRRIILLRLNLGELLLSLFDERLIRLDLFSVRLDCLIGASRNQ
jgi:hypothetical protein